MKTLENIEGVIELEVYEQRKISGGESLWYHIGYALGKGYRFISEALDNTPTPPSASVYK